MSSVVYLHECLVDSFKPIVTEMALMELVGHKRKAKDMNIRKGLGGGEVVDKV